MTNDELNRLRTLADAATPGPWTAASNGLRSSPEWEVVDCTGLAAFVANCGTGDAAAADAAFIAEAREVIPRLIDALLEARKETRELEQHRLDYLMAGLYSYGP